MPQHPDATIRRAIRVLAMIGELHKRGYQRLRVMPYLSPSGAYWRCEVGPVDTFYRNHGAILREFVREPDRRLLIGPRKRVFWLERRSRGRCEIARR